MKKEDSLPKKGDKFEMKKMIIAIVCAVVILIAGIFGAKALLFPGDKNPETDLDTPIVPITDAQNPNGQEANPDAPAVNIPAVTPVAPTGSDDPLKIYDNGAATFSYDSTKLIFDEIPPSEENGIPMVSFMPVDAEDVLPRVDAMPLTVSASGEGAENFYNIDEESWKQLAAACILEYLSPTSKDAAQISFENTVVKPESATSAKMFTNISLSIPADIAVQTGDASMNGSVRLVANGENAMITMAMSRQSSSLPESLKDVYMSMELH